MWGEPRKPYKPHSCGWGALRFYDVVDEQGRYVGLKVEQGEPQPIMTSHAYSYLKARELMQEAGIVMGLEKKVQDD